MSAGTTSTPCAPRRPAPPRRAFSSVISAQALARAPSSPVQGPCVRLLHLRGSLLLAGGSGEIGLVLGAAGQGLFADCPFFAVRRAVRTYDDIARRWTVEKLAREAGMSRAAFAERFARRLGMPPMHYVLEWRMAIAKDMLRRERHKLAEVAERIGYQSASALSTAFTRLAGCSLRANLRGRRKTSARRLDKIRPCETRRIDSDTFVLGRTVMKVRKLIPWRPSNFCSLRCWRRMPTGWRRGTANSPSCTRRR